MSTASIVILTVAIVVIAILVWMLLRKERTKKLRSLTPA
jgi:lipoprotein signal peptidase